MSTVYGNANIIRRKGIRTVPHIEVVPGMILVEGVIIDVRTDVEGEPLSNGRVLFMDTATATIVSDPRNTVVVLGTVEDEVLDAIKAGLGRA